MADATIIIAQAAVILPYRDGKLLMQLRDDKDGIVFPGMWGFFSGTIEPGETPLECAHRELYEEIGYKIRVHRKLSVDQLSEPLEIVLHSFLTPLESKCSELTLYEGSDFGLFWPDEILSKQLLAQRKRKYVPVIDNPYIPYIINKFIQLSSQHEV